VCIAQKVQQHKQLDLDWTQLLCQPHYSHALQTQSHSIQGTRACANVLPLPVIQISTHSLSTHRTASHRSKAQHSATALTHTQPLSPAKQRCAHTWCSVAHTLSLSLGPDRAANKTRTCQSRHGLHSGQDMTRTHMHRICCGCVCNQTLSTTYNALRTVTRHKCKQQ
jgi:hypothetical protein